MFIFTPAVFSILEDGFREFLGSMKNPKKDEYLLPTVISEAVNAGKVELRCVETDERWMGVTYREDLPGVVESIKKKIDRKEYPQNLWN